MYMITPIPYLTSNMGLKGIKLESAHKPLLRGLAFLVSEVSVQATKGEKQSAVYPFIKPRTHNNNQRWKVFPTVIMAFTSLK